MPPRMVSKEWVWNSSEAATPKLPPPPRSAQNRSGSCSPSTMRTAPSAVTSSTAVRLSIDMPYLPINQPNPPPRVRPATARRRDHAAGGGLAVGVGDPVVLVPRDAALCPRPPAARVHIDAAHQRQVDHQPTLGDGPAGHVVASARTEISSPASRPNATASRTSATLRQRAIRPGRPSTRPLCTARTSSYPRSSGATSNPLKQQRTPQARPLNPIAHLLCLEDPAFDDRPPKAIKATFPSGWLRALGMA